MVLGGAHGKAAKVKRLQGHVLSGRMLCTLLQAYVEAINTGGVPNIGPSLLIQKGTRVLVSLWESLMFGRVVEYLSRYGIR